ncbi:hypothetical protein JCM4814A_41110 [Streptomyces phaeofaciens JCM 4814]|uniref:Uncharacterized protein n=1 Tax=Streptomyces phaeofaciens TaxID=68254 RepID=A0A918HLU4_9ACTN|nr:hypothetical protein GCM10010226_69160 [Streptomyces phaeofaciens]
MPSVTVTVTGLVKAAFFVPSAGETEITGFLAAAEAFAAPDAVVPVCSEASAAPELHPVSATAGTAAPSAARTPRRDHPCDCCSDRFDMCETPTPGLSEMSTFVPASCAPHLGRSFEWPGRSLRFP